MLFLWFTCCLLVWLLLRIFLFLLLLLLVILLFCFLTLFRMGAVKLCTVIPYLRKIRKLYKSRDTSLELCWHQHFSTEISKFCYIKKYTYRLEFDRIFLILLTFLESLVIFLTNMVTILMMSAKITTLGLLKIRVFWNKGYDIIIFVYDVIIKIYLVIQTILEMWSCGQSLVTVAFLWEKLS